ncbi:3-dehydroquinate synthase family protein [Granulicella tundricola]|uniref:3-dehydroquinate synthase family protein n=1 Tax=Granulicella tundricola TaxID=940615 RepID=UPI0002EF8911|nr:3-dehydroquinate synthase [Granulicella tundricola]
MINSSTGSYQVTIESHSLRKNLLHFSKAKILADEFFAPVLADLASPPLLIRAIEENKSLDVSPSIIEGLRQSGANRQTELVAIGGGIIQDLSAFIASIYMRGLTWSYLPTTILAMVDSCIGGKSSINVGPYKNLVGTFHPPHQVLIDPALAQTLPPDQQASGLIEAAKICFCRGPEAFDRHIALLPSVMMETGALEALIYNSLEAKKWFIEIDEFDNKERLLLNFGHTFGHAIEGATHFAIPHGIAVGLGILCAITYQVADGIDYSSSPRVALLELHLAEMIANSPGTPRALASMSADEMFQRFASDKKHGTEDYALILIDQAGKVVLHRVPKSPEVSNKVRAAVESVVGRFRG